MKQNTLSSLSRRVALGATFLALSFGSISNLSLASGGSGGGSGGGGGGTVTATKAPAITTFKVTSGYGPYGGRDGDLQANYSVDMGTSGLSPSVRVTIVDVGTGATWWNSTTSIPRGSAGYRYLPLNKTFTVTVELLDPNGLILDRKSTNASTPAAPKVGTT